MEREWVKQSSSLTLCWLPVIDVGLLALSLYRSMHIMTITIMMIFVIFRNGQQVDEILLPFLVVPLRCATNEHLKWSSPDSVRSMRGFTTSLPLSLCLSLRTPSLSPATLYTHFVTFWHIFVACHSRHSPHFASSHSASQSPYLVPIRERRRRPFYFPQPPHYRHVVLPIGLARYGGANEKSPGIFWGTHVCDVSR